MTGPLLCPQCVQKSVQAAESAAALQESAEAAELKEQETAQRTALHNSDAGCPSARRAKRIKCEVGGDHRERERERERLTYR